MEEQLNDLDKAFGGQLLPALQRAKFDGTKGMSPRLATFGAIAAKDLVVVGHDGTPSALHDAAAAVGMAARTAHAQSVALALPEMNEATTTRVLEAAIAGNYSYQAYKSDESRSPSVDTWTLSGATAPAEQLAIRAKWQSWARDLVNMPPADLYPESLAAHAQELASLPNTTVDVWDLDTCVDRGCVGTVAVGASSARPPVQIHVAYRPDNAKDHIAFVGKGVTFDAGGLSIKPSAAMLTMKCDMGGSATVLAAAAAIAELQLPIAFDCFVGAAENMLASDSYKLGDVLRYPNGVTVEIHNTDAEGRLLLADCLLRACSTEGVTKVVDAATLTGAAVVALGPDFSGLFTKCDTMASGLLAAADETGEGLWRMPLHAPYNTMLKSDVATIKNVGGREAGATTAALFLEHFVEGPQWAHLDIAGPAFHDKADHRYAPGATGEMVRTLVEWAERLSQ